MADCSSTDQLYELLMNEAVDHYERREVELGESVMREVERQVMLRIVDQKWREHLEEMDYLREGINLRAMGQKDPLTEWQREGFGMFEQMMKGVATDFVRYAMQVQVNVVRPGEDGEQPAIETVAPMKEPSPDVLGAGEAEVTGISYSAPDEALSGGGLAAAAAAGPVAGEEDGPAQAPTPEAPPQNVPVVKSEFEKTPRNAPCPCGSGKKFKLCHGA
jgi:preprotein translocase subunit SecA